MLGCRTANAHPEIETAAASASATVTRVHQFCVVRIGSPPCKRKTAARNRPTCDGMRRCQRLPELTHPVDLARPQRVTSNPVPVKYGVFRAKEADARPF